MSPLTSAHVTTPPAGTSLSGEQSTGEPSAGGQSPSRTGQVLNRVIAACGGVMLMAMMALTVVDVIGRYIFSAPLTGAGELTELLLAATIFLGLPAVSLNNEHVTVDLVTDRLAQRLQPWRKAAIGLVSALVLVVVAWRIWVYADQIAAYGGSTSSLRIPIAPLGYFCAICTVVGAALSAAVPLITLFKSFKGKR